MSISNDIEGWEEKESVPLTREDLQGLEDEIRSLQIRTRITGDQFQVTPLLQILGVLLFLVGGFFGWAFTPTYRQSFRYDYQISRAGAPRLAIDPGAAGIPGLSKRPVFIGPAALSLPRLQPKQQPKK
jgi:hypothetical protein